ncbi:MAG TPA: PQQ-binding-like beta-propeller repeat protein, partial [Acidimicrobiales bacterium]|nr:PQQ-binding-like beta-propeller repeat protein [Acidimicrobiales bacterium]
GSTFSDNSATLRGGAVDNGDGSSGTGVATIAGSTFSGDTAGRGGAIDNGDDAGSGSLLVKTSTFFDETAWQQGAVVESTDSEGTSSALVLSSTIDGSVGNAAVDAVSGTVQIAGSIVAQSSKADCAGTIADAGYNLEDDPADSCGFSLREYDIVGLSPDLGPLGSNGGPTQTMEPAASSPVLNQIPDPASVLVGANNQTLFLCPVTDQQGERTATETYGCAIGSVDPANGVPVVTSLGTKFGPAAGGNTVVLNGGNFAAGAAVDFGTAKATNVDVVSSTEITAAAPAFAGLDDRGQVLVTVTDPTGPASPANPAAVYTYESADWSAYLGGPSHSSFNAAATSINSGTIGNLQPVWQWDPPVSPDTGSLADFASPITAGGVVYVGLADGEFYAIKEATQQVLWSQFLGFYTSSTCSGSEGITSTAAVADDPTTGEPTVYVNAPNGYLYALDAATGGLVWRSVVGIPSANQNDYYAWGSPAVANGSVYIGVSSRCSSPDVAGGAIGFAQHTGAQIGRWYAQPSGVVGGSVWSSLAVLPDGDVVVATGNGDNSKPQVPYSESVVELNGSNMDFLDGWQLPASEQIYDSDFGSSPTVFTGYPGGVATTMVGSCNKDGYYFAFRADDLHAGPVWQTMIGAPAGSAPAGGGECDSAAIWNGHELIEGGDGISLGGTAYQGSVQALNPTTGVPIWRTGLPGNVIGSPSEDGGGVIAAPVYQSSSGDTGVYLLSASTGAILDYISTEPGSDFAQPVFDGSDLLVGALDSEPVTAYAITRPGQADPVAVSPSSVEPGTTDTLTITDATGLTSPANVIISSGGVEVTSVVIDGPTEATIKVSVSSAEPAGALDVTLTEPDLAAYTCSDCLTVG